MKNNTPPVLSKPSQRTASIEVVASDTLQLLPPHGEETIESCDWDTLAEILAGILSRLLEEQRDPESQSTN